MIRADAKHRTLSRMADDHIGYRHIVYILSIFIAYKCNSYNDLNY